MTFVSCSFVLVNSKKYVQESEAHLLDFAAVFILTTVFRRLLIRSANFRSAFRVIVGFSLNLYVLIFFGGALGSGREAGVKYYYLSTFSSGLRIYGIFLVLVLLETLNFVDVADALTDRAFTKKTLALLGVRLGLLLTGIFFKLSAFPGHL